MGNDEAKNKLREIQAKIDAGKPSSKAGDAAPPARPSPAAGAAPMDEGAMGEKPATVTSTGRQGEGVSPFGETVSSASIPVPKIPSVTAIQRQLLEMQGQAAEAPSGGTVAGTSEPGEKTANGRAPAQDGYDNVQFDTLIGSYSVYTTAFMRAKNVLETLKDTGYFSEHGLEEVQVNILVEADGTPSVEVVRPKDWTQESTYSIEKMIIDMMENVLPEKVEPPQLDGQGMRIALMPLHINPRFWDLDVQERDKDGKPIPDKYKDTQMLQITLRKILNLHSKELQKKGVDIVNLTLKLKKTREVVLIAVKPAEARGILVDELMGKLKEFSTAYRDSTSPMLYPKTTDVIWPFEHKVERTWYPERAQILEAKKQQAGALPPAQPAPVTVPNAPAIQAQQPAAQAAPGNGGFVEPVAAERSGPAPKISDVNPDHIIAKVIESTDGRISFSVCLMNPETGKDREIQQIVLKTAAGSSKKTVVGGMDADVDLTDKDRPVLLLNRKPVPTVMAQPAAAESQAAQTIMMTAVAAQPAEKPSYRSEAEAAVVGAVATGMWVSIAAGWFQQVASKIPFIGQISIPQHTEMLGNIDSSLVAGAAAALTATVSAVLIALGVRSKKKGDTQ